MAVCIAQLSTPDAVPASMPRIHPRSVSSQGGRQPSRPPRLPMLLGPGWMPSTPRHNAADGLIEWWPKRSGHSFYTTDGG